MVMAALVAPSRLRSCRRRRLAGQDLGQPVDVDLVEHAAAARLLEARDEIGAQDVDLAVQEPALIADLPLLLLELSDEALQRAVFERAEVGKGFHVVPPFVVGQKLRYSSRGRKNRQPQLKGSAQELIQLRAPISSRSITSITSVRSSVSRSSEDSVVSPSA